MKFKKVKLNKIVGTGLKGYFKGSYKSIVKIFGVPEKSLNEKTQVNWRIEFDDGIIATIYDWKVEQDYNINKDWNIGGHTRKGFYYVAALLMKKERHELVVNLFGEFS